MADPTRDAVNAKAAAYLVRTGNADLLPVLGLADPAEALVVDGRRMCPTCGRPLPDPLVNGGSKPCRRRACVKAREAGAA